MQNPMSACPHCGAQISANAQFCKSCGKPIAPEQPTSDAARAVNDQANTSAGTRVGASTNAPFIPAAPSLDRTGLMRTGWIEIARRVIALVCLAGALATFLTPAPVLLRVATADQEWLRNKNPLVTVEGSEWEVFFRAVKDSTQGKPPDAVWRARLNQSGAAGSSLFFRPNETPLNRVAVELNDARPLTYLELVDGAQTRYLSVTHQRPREMLGLMGDDDAPAHLMRPYRWLSLWLVLLGLAVYVLLPRPRHPPQALTYGWLRAVLRADLIGLVFFGFFFAAPWYAIPRSSATPDLFALGSGALWFMFVCWLLALVFVIPLAAAAWYALYEILVLPDRLRVTTLWNRQEYLYRDMAKVYAYTSEPPPELLLVKKIYDEFQELPLKNQLSHLISLIRGKGIAVQCRDGRALRFRLSALRGTERLLPIFQQNGVPVTPGAGVLLGAPEMASSEVRAVPTSIGMLMSRTEATCLNCGATVSTSARFCKMCGGSLVQPAAAPPGVAALAAPAGEQRPAVGPESLASAISPGVNEIPLAPRLDRTGLTRTGLIEIARRAIALLGLVAALATCLVPVSALIRVAPHDFAGQQKKELFAEERQMPLAEYIVKETEGRLITVQGPEWRTLFQSASATASGKPPDSAWSERRSQGWFPGDSVYFRPDEAPLSSVARKLNDENPFTFLALTGSVPAQYLGVTFQRSYDMRDDAPTAMAYPWRQFSLWLALLGLAAYVLLPRRKHPPEALTYSRIRAILLPDLLAFLLLSVFLGLPLLALSYSTFTLDPFDLSNGLETLVFWMFALGWILILACLILWIFFFTVGWYAATEILMLPDRLRITNAWSEREYVYRDIVQVRDYTFKPPRWLVQLTSIFSWLGLPLKGQLSKLTSTMNWQGIAIEYRDGRSARLSVDALSESPRLLQTLRQYGVPVTLDAQVLLSRTDS